MQQDIFPEDFPTDRPADYDPLLNGLGGWFTLVIISEVLTIIDGSVTLLQVLSDATTDRIAAFTYIIIAIIAALMAASVAILHLITVRNIKFRTIYVIQSVASLVLSIALLVITTSAGGYYDYLTFIARTLGALLWVTYLYRSRRVKYTFIYPFQYAVSESFLADDE